MKNKTINGIKNAVRAVSGLSNLSLHYLKKEDKEMIEISLETLSKEMTNLQGYIAWYARSVSNTIEIDRDGVVKDLVDKELI